MMMSLTLGKVQACFLSVHFISDFFQYVNETNLKTKKDKPTGCFFALDLYRPFSNLSAKLQLVENSG